MADTEATLIARGKNYGCFQSGATTMQNLKSVIRDNQGYEHLTAPQREALDMILHKVGRIVNGNASHVDSWHDISGYAQLIENQLNGVGEQ